jgi:methionyl aminopeptidase
MAGLKQIKKVTIKTREEIELMRRAGQVVGQTIRMLGKTVKPGMTTMELDAIANDYIVSHGCTPAFYLLYNFPGHICICVNDEAVHGVPNDRVLKEGDIVTFDVGATYQGWNADAAATFPVGKVPSEVLRLLKVTRESLYAGIERARAGRRLNDISWAIYKHARRNGFNVVEELAGHGIGQDIHEEPEVLNVPAKLPGIFMRPGMCLAIEPIVTQRSPKVILHGDKHTISTEDGRLAAHFEHTIAITDGKPDILTRWE